VIAYVQALAAATALPLILYLRGPAIGPDEIETLSAIESVVAVKFARPQPELLPKYMERGGDSINWICGLAEQWAPLFYAAGARGFTSGLVNVAPRHSLAIHAALEAGRYPDARRLIADIAEFEALRSLDQNGTNVTVVKAALSLLGRDSGPVRPPGSPALSTAALERLSHMIERWRRQGIVSGESG
jgi:4-hydroxy-tetrahydrodipicolinate synthase